MHARNMRIAAAGIALSLLCIAPAIAGENDYPLIQRGKYLAEAADCAACHTAQREKPFAGGLGVPTPFGTIYSTNITPDKETGIGNWSTEDLYRAMHDGMMREGE